MSTLTPAQAELLNLVSRQASYIRSAGREVADRAANAVTAINSTPAQRPSSPGFTVLGQSAADLERAATALHILLDFAPALGLTAEQVEAALDHAAPHFFAS